MESIGQQLKKAREGKQMTVAEVAQVTKAGIRYIEAMEADNFSAFPAAVYALGFIRLYAGCVGLNPQPLMQAYRERVAMPAPAPAPMPALVKKTRGPEPAPAKKRYGSAATLAGKDRMPQPVVETAASIPRVVAMRWQAALVIIRWPAIKGRWALLSAIRLPVETWKNILAIAGMACLVIMAVLVLGWYVLLKPGAEPSASSRWLMDPPAPYLAVE